MRLARWNDNHDDPVAALVQANRGPTGRSPGEYVEHCVSLARRITNEQFSQLVALQLRSGESVDKIVHYAVKEYLCRIGTPNRQNQ